jgi:Uma2 family endonuclease
MSPECYDDRMLSPADPSFESVEYFTQDQFEVWCERHANDVARYELLGGRIVMSPQSGWPQGEASAVVARVLGNFVARKRLGRVFGADQGFRLPTGDTPGPDAAFVSHRRWKAAGPKEHGKHLRLVPELVVEVRVADLLPAE